MKPWRNPEIVSLGGAARLLGVGPEVVMRLIAERGLPFHLEWWKQRGAQYFNVGSLTAWREQNGR